MSEEKKAAQVSAEVAKNTAAVAAEEPNVTKLDNSVVLPLRFLGFQDFTNPDKADPETGEVNKKLHFWFLDYSSVTDDGLFTEPKVLDKWVKDNSLDWLVKNPVPFSEVPCKVILSSRSSKDKDGKYQTEVVKFIKAFMSPEDYKVYKRIMNL